MNTFRNATMAMLVAPLVAGQANADSLSDTGLAYTYTYAAGTTVAGPGAADEEANPFVLNDGFFTSQADIDADAGAVGGYYVNGGENNGVIIGTGPGNNRSITFDLGSVQDLRLLDMYYAVNGPFAVDAPWQVDVIIDGGAPISFNPFNITPTVRTGAPPTGDARLSTIDLTGQSGQIITLDFYSDGRTDLAGGGSQSGAFGGEWTSMNEIVFNPERVTPQPAGVTPYNEAVLADSPAYYWTFDEEGIVNAIEQVQGLAADEFVPGANAAKVESATTAGGVSLGQAARIEGSGGFTWNVADLSGSGMTGAWAYEFWANADDVTTYEYMIGSNAAGGFNNETILKWGPGGEPAGMQLYNGGGVLNPVAVAMTAGWHHYVFVTDGATPEYDLYVDGAFAGKIGNANAHGPHPEVALKLGGWTDGASAEVFDGLLDELAIYDLSGVGDLSAAGQKIAAHYSASSQALRTKFSYDDATGMLTVEWESRDGRLYNVRSEADLSAGDPITWPIFGGSQDLVATPPENSVTFPLPADAARFFVVEEFPAPPVSVFSDDFESGQGAWTTGGAPGSDPATNWELGSPSNVGPASANNGASCFGTNLSANYGNDVDIWLRSPALDLTTAVGATLKFSHYVDIEEVFDFGEIRLLDADDANAELAVLQMAIDGNNPTGWEAFSKSLPPTALGKNVLIEFRFLSDNFNGGPQAGWYIDDVVVTVP